MNYKDKWVIKCVFVDDNDQEKGASYYDSVLYDTEAKVLEWLDSDDKDPTGLTPENLIEICNLDAEVERDLKGLYFDSTDGFVPIQVKNLPYTYQP